MSARDNIKKANMVSLDSERKVETIVDDIQNQFENMEASDEIKEVIPEVKPIKKKAPGRPRKFAKDENTVVLGIRVKEEEALFLEEYGGKFGGKTGYVTYLIRQEMNKVIGK